MKNNKGITLTMLVILITVVLILLSVGASVSIDLVRKGNEEKIVNNMLLIQAKAKIIMEKVTFTRRHINVYW